MVGPFPARHEPLEFPAPHIHIKINCLLMREMSLEQSAPHRLAMMQLLN